MCEMLAVLAACGQATVIGPLGGGNRSMVLELWLGGQRLAAPKSRRPPASLDWEIDLLTIWPATACRRRP